jgi:hypothetical protein
MGGIIDAHLRAINVPVVHGIIGVPAVLEGYEREGRGAAGGLDLDVPDAAVPAYIRRGGV